MNRHMRRRADRQSGQAKQAQMQLSQIQKLQEELENLTVEGSAGGGVVKIVMTGKQQVESVTIDPEVLDDVELLQDLIAAAVNDASAKTQETMAQKMGAITGGLNIPGLT